MKISHNLESILFIEIPFKEKALFFNLFSILHGLFSAIPTYSAKV